MKIDYARLLAGEESSFTPMTWDRYDFHALAEFSPEIASQDAEGLRRFGRSLVQDAFFALSGLSPREDDGMGRSWQRATQEEGFGKLRERFKRGTRMEKALAVLGLHQAVLQSFMTNSGDPGGEDPTILGIPPIFPLVVPQQSTDEPPAAYEDIVDLNENDEQEQDDSQGNALAIHAEDLESAVDCAALMSDFVSTVEGFLDGGPPQIFQEAMEVSDNLDLRDFARILGFTKRVIGGANRETKQGSEEFTGYRSGGLEDRTHPMDVIALANGDPAARMRLIDRALVNREFHSERPSGLGPVCVLRDESGSMGGVNAEYRHKRALAFELALASEFNRQGRDLVSIRWGSYPAPPFVYGEGNLKEHASSFLNHSSTVLVQAMQKAIKVSEEYVDGMDILVITDGDLSSGQSEQLQNIISPFRDRGGRVWVVVIKNSSWGVTDKRNLTWADHWIHVDSLRTDNAMEGLLSRMATREQPRRVRLV